ncbi:MAG: T9SS type A sorting domain-containing protein [Bacteroidota bacterium]
MKNYSSFLKVFILMAFIFVSNVMKAQFVSGNLVVLKVGNGVDTLVNLGNACYLQEYNLSGTLVSTISLSASATDPFCVSGSATSEGQISKSSDGTLICLAGYKIAPPYTSSLASSTSAAINRVVIQVNNAGVISTAATTSTAFSANNIRSAVSDGNNNYWAAGGSTGVYHFGSTASDTAVVSTTSTNIRFIDIFNSQLYYTTNKGTFGLYQVGTGTPTTSGQTSTNIIATGSTSSPFAFALNSTIDTCYITDDRVVSSGGGIQKWVKSAGIWTLAYTLGSGTSSTVGCRSLTVKWGEVHPIIYATTAETTNNRIIKILDSNSTALAATLATSASNTLFRGIAFAPDNNAVPNVTTVAYSNLSPFSVNVSGNVISDGGSAVLARGICWDTIANPTIASSHTSEIGTLGVFSSTLNGLLQNRTYYARAYASNAIGVSYGSVISFTTPIYIPTYTISQVKGINAQGVGDSVNVYCKLHGVVHGLNFTTVGLSFYMMDAMAGINIYSNPGTYNYTVAEGDSIKVIGKIQQSRGLIEIVPDSIVKISSASTLNTPVLLSTLNDSHESSLIKMEYLTYLSGWPIIPGITASVSALKGTDTVTIMIFTQCNLQGTPAPVAPFHIIGIESQYTTSLNPPFLSNYFIIPRYISDLIRTDNVNAYEEQNVSIYPNPSDGRFNIETKQNNALDINIYTVQGSLIYHKTNVFSTEKIDISDKGKAVYLIQLIDSKTGDCQTHKLIVH